MKRVLYRGVGQGSRWQGWTDVGYAAPDKDGELKTKETTMEDVIRRQPEDVLRGVVGDIPVILIKDLHLQSDAALDLRPGNRVPDLIALTSDGAVYVIECKLSANYQSRGEVLDQVRRYAERLLRLEYSGLNRRYLEQKRPHDDDNPTTTESTPARLTLSEMMEAKVRGGARTRPAVDAADWSRSEWEASVSDKLKSGAVTMVVAVDHVHSQLYDALGGYNISYAADSYETVWALELLRIVHGTAEFLIPHAMIPRTATRTRPTTHKEAYRVATAHAKAVQGRLEVWATVRDLRSKPTSASYRVIGPDGKRMLTVYLNPKVDKLELNLQRLAPDHAKAVGIELVRLFGPVAQSYPNISLADVDRTWDDFSSTVLNSLANDAARSTHVS